MWRQYQQQDLALHQLWLAPHIWFFEVRYDALLADHVQRSPAAICLTLIIQLGIKHKVWTRWIREGRVLACLMSKSQLSICCLVFEFITFCAQFCYFFQGQNVPLLLLPTALGVGQYEAHDVMLVMVFCFESCFAEVMQQLFLISLVQLDLFKIRQRMWHHRIQAVPTVYCSCSRQRFGVVLLFPCCLVVECACVTQDPCAGIVCWLLTFD